MITVVGAGYVGLVTSACLAELGHDVTCVEIAPARLSSIQRGRLPVHEPGLDNLVKTNRKAGRLRFTSHNGDALAGSQFAFIAVHTPSGPAGQADTSFVFSAVRSVIERAPPALTIVVKSTRAHRHWRPDRSSGRGFEEEDRHGLQSRIPPARSRD